MSQFIGSKAPLRILIVEDNRDARTMMRMRLTLRHGHAVTEAANGAEGVQAALATRPHVALIDVGLPDIDGFEVARRIRAGVGDAVVLVALTGYGTDDDRARAFAAGFDHFLVKPAEGAALVAILDAVAA
jgi:DNA-binding response OmpR family regulator